MWFESWIGKQEHPEEWRYVYRLDQLHGLPRPGQLHVIDGGNRQLINEPGFVSTLAAYGITQVIETNRYHAQPKRD